MKESMQNSTIIRKDNEMEEIKSISKLNENDEFNKYELMEVVNDNLIIIKESKLGMDKRFGFVNNLEPINPKYYFADKNGIKLSKSFYSIEKLDDIHYEVSEMDFMYSPGFDKWTEQYGNKFEDCDLYRFKFHYGIVSVIGKEIKQVVPIVYHKIKKTNNGVIFVWSDERFKVKINNNLHIEPIYIEPKLGAINLDPNSNQYGMNIIPTVCDSITDFDLKYKGYAYAKLGETSGYLAKYIDFDRYQNYLQAYETFIKCKKTTYNDYKNLVEQSIATILYTEEEILKSETDVNNLSKVKSLGTKSDKIK